MDALIPGLLCGRHTVLKQSSTNTSLSLSPPALFFLTSLGVLSFSFPLFLGSSLLAGSCWYSQEGYLDPLVTRDEIK